MSKKTITKEMLTSAQLKIAKADIETISRYRRDPNLAVRELFNIQLMDYQAWILQSTWVAENAVWVISRNGGKSILSALYISLRQMLFPETEHWILGKSGKQAKKLFSYIERIATDNISSFKDISDVYLGEVKQTGGVGNGFSHDPSGHKVTLLNEARVTSLNDNPDGNRGKFCQFSSNCWKLLRAS